MTDDKLSYALTYLMTWIGEGRRLSEADDTQKKLIKYATRLGYIDQTALKHGDWLLNPTRRAP